MNIISRLNVRHSGRPDGCTLSDKMSLSPVTGRSGQRLSSLLVLLVLWAGFGIPLVFAGGPRGLYNGQPIRWKTSPIPCLIDRGNLGPLDNAHGADLVRQAFQAWADVPTSTIQFSDNGFLPADVTVANYMSYLNGQVPLQGNPIIFDTDGSIIDDYFGTGSSRTVLGFSSAEPSQDYSQYVFTFAVLNGKFASTVNSEFKQTMVHEFGHSLGLDHTQAGYDFFESGKISQAYYIPVMFPYYTSGAPSWPMRDDIAWISWLYPSANFHSTTGTIKGYVFHRSGAPFLGANVVAVKLDGLEQSKTEIVSAVSDFLATGDGSYELPGLTPGDYVVYIEPLDPRFTMSSGVGPYDARSVNFPKDYYAGPDESGTEDPDLQTVIHVVAGQTVDNIDVISNDLTNRLDLLGDDDEMEYVFPDGFTFPFFGKKYNSVYVNSDGNLTFGAGDSSSDLRDQTRFLSGPPRIAPLFTDMDPSAGGQVRAETTANSVTFIWDFVPEFSDSGFAQGNKFSVTLYINGDISIKYDQVAVTPDPDPVYVNDGLQAVVGVTPGNSVQGASQDLSSLGGTIAMGDQPIFQVFPGTQFDLTGQEVFFQAKSTPFYFPFYRGDGQTYTGLAITNFSSAATPLTFQGFGADGQLLPFPDNPHVESLDAAHQLAKLGSEIFGIPFATQQSGWLQLNSETPNLAGFFQYGNGFSDGLVTKMDGAIPFQKQYTTFYFTRVFEGVTFYPSPYSAPLEAHTYLSIANPNHQAVTLDLRLFDGTGQILNEVNKSIPAQGVLYESVADLFDAPYLRDGHVQVTVTQGTGAVGFEMIELPDSLVGLNATPGNPNNESFSAQLTDGLAGGTNVFTNLKLVNTSLDQRFITLTAFLENADKSISQLVRTVTISAHQSLQGDAGVILGLPTPAPSVGSLRMQADGPGVIGDVIFGDAQKADYAAGMLLQNEPFSKAIFGQVANGMVDPNNRSTDYLTGMAFFNPGGQAAQVTLKVYDRDGVLQGQTTPPLTIGPKGRYSELLEILLPSTASLMRGYVVLESTQPIVAQEFFANMSMKFLSAVPPQKLN